MANLTGPTHAEVRDRLLGEGSAELREEYARLRLRRAAMAAVEPSSNAGDGWHAEWVAVGVGVGWLGSGGCRGMR